MGWRPGRLGSFLLGRKRDELAAIAVSPRAGSELARLRMRREAQNGCRREQISAGGIVPFRCAVFLTDGYLPILKESSRRSSPQSNGITRDSALDMLSST